MEKVIEGNKYWVTLFTTSKRYGFCNKEDIITVFAEGEEEAFEKAQTVFHRHNRRRIDKWEVMKVSKDYI